MRSVLAKTLLPLALSAGLTVAGCSTQVSVRPTYPSAADLVVEAKPQPTIETMTSAIASADLNNAIEKQRDEFAGRLGRLCRYFDAKGMPGLDCPPPEPDS